MSNDSQARDGWGEAPLRDLIPRLEELERRLRSAVSSHPAATLALAAAAGVALGLMPRRLKLAALAMSAHSFAPLALRALDLAFFEAASKDPHRRM